MGKPLLALFQNPVLSVSDILQTVVTTLMVLAVGMTVHEFAHCLVADQMGDDTPRRLGRLTLNPVVHVNWLGWLMFALIGFGILGSAPIDARRMRNPRWGYLAAVAAGPLANLFLAIIFALIAAFIGPRQLEVWPKALRTFIMMMIHWNLLLAIFNLLPLYPLDGWQIVFAALPPGPAYEWRRHAQTSQYAFFALIIISFMLPNFNLLGTIIGEPLRWLTELLLSRENTQLLYLSILGY